MIRCRLPRCTSDFLHLHGCFACPAVQTTHPFSFSLFNDLAVKKIPVAHPLSHVKELPFRTPPMTFALSGRAPIGGKASRLDN